MFLASMGKANHFEMFQNTMFFKKYLFLFCVYEYFACIYAHAKYILLGVHGGQMRVSDPPETGVVDGNPPCGR